MSDAVAGRLRRTIIEIDRQILGILLPNTRLDDAQVASVATLEQARNAAHRLLLLAEAGELEDGAP
ncbi:hypothetical protein [uncultured Phenylobacterium sp.]|uniref:hypothetical protein n=1 Tax=uncultured Phenylobacterium sp. TaxID=349273 RepID=UPI0025FF6BA6|nr:hypothetical protein [uncultured Phenylobacterium sp.]